MAIKPRWITKQEWFLIRTLRGQAMTGQSAHRTGNKPIDPKRPGIVKGVGKTYYWCMGAQPSEEVIAKIARKCPIEAAEAYLEHYERVPPDAQPGQYHRPVPRSDD